MSMVTLRFLRVVGLESELGAGEVLQIARAQ